MRQVLLINTPFLNVDKSISIPTGLIALASYVKFQRPSTDCNISILDLNLELFPRRPVQYNSLKNKCLKIIENHICAHDAIVGFGTLASTYPLIISICKELKRVRPNLKIVFGGPHASLTYEQTLKEYGEIIDHIIVGEGEKAFYRYLKSLDNKEKTQEAKFSGSEQIDNLNDLPLMDLGLIDLNRYISIGGDSFKLGIEAGRGCVFKCNYCSTAIMWKHRYRIKNVKRLISEIEHYSKKYAVDSYDFIHDNLTIDRKFVADLCKSIVLKRMNVSWGCQSRADLIDRDILSLMSRAGCKTIFIGVESFSPQILKAMNKNINLNELEIHEKMGEVAKSGIKPVVSLMMGFPFESKRDLEINFVNGYRMRIMGAENVLMCLLELHYGTKFYEDYKDSMRFFKPVAPCLPFIIDSKTSFLLKKHPKLFSSFYSTYSSGEDQRKAVALRDNFSFFCDCYPRAIGLSHKFSSQTYYNILRNIGDRCGSLVKNKMSLAKLQKLLCNNLNYDASKIILEVLKYEDNIVKISQKENHLDAVRLHKSNINIPALSKFILEDGFKKQSLLHGRKKRYVFRKKRGGVDVYEVPQSVHDFVLSKGKKNNLSKGVIYKLEQEEIIIRR